MFKPTLVAAVDIGSPNKGNLAWAIAPDESFDADFEGLVKRIAEASAKGPVSLGFEAPLWVPMRDDLNETLKPRQGEEGRSWSAGPGASTLAAALGVVPNLLTTLRAAMPSAVVTLDYRNPPSEPGTILMWEAFVSGEDKGVDHKADALIAAQAFAKNCGDLPACQKLTPEPCLNLLGAMLLRTGWSDDLSLLEAEMLVVRI
ncbi:hypothetical protein V6C03_06595 [Methyloligella sp. 2.7D]|uniref:hypothetical protein n=1 Tax=unclassified Methyloligella TaxID=2625955 RepID=UPI00157BDF63|nr:hypothetical protein [Methyloligella sp. GL2]QKP78431.1 hypothetical protein HT051_13855 [Methyloligella sp. GL2]